jgi:hypothetical protein
VRVYTPPDPNPLFNQSDHVVTIETTAGITGIGEGGSRDTLEQSAGRLIGKDDGRNPHDGKTVEGAHHVGANLTGNSLRSIMLIVRQKIIKIHWQHWFQP